MKLNIGNIVNLMCEKNINQGQLARVAGLNVQTVSALLRGQSNPTLKTIDKIAKFFGCEPKDIVDSN